MCSCFNHLILLGSFVHLKGAVGLWQSFLSVFSTTNIMSLSQGTLEHWNDTGKKYNT